MAIKYVLPNRGEFGLKICYHVPAVHALEGPKIVAIEEGEEALYPSADGFDYVTSPPDSTRRGFTSRLDDLRGLAQEARGRLGQNIEMVSTSTRMPRERFIPEPVTLPPEFRRRWTRREPIDVFLAPRRRDYGSSKNWDAWPEVAGALVADGSRVFAGGREETSYRMPEGVEVAWAYANPLDVTIAALRLSRVIVTTDAGLAHLAVLCGRHVLMVVSGPEGRTAPGPVVDATGRVMLRQYGPVQWERYEEAGAETGGTVTPVLEGWELPGRVLHRIRSRLAASADA